MSDLGDVLRNLIDRADWYGDDGARDDALAAVGRVEAAGTATTTTTTTAPASTPTTPTA